MRPVVAALVTLGAAATAQSTDGYLKCAEAALGGIDASKFNDCTDKSSTECFCANKNVIKELSSDAKSACEDAGVDLSKLESSICSSKGSAAPARHASKPMQPAMNGAKRSDDPMSDMDMRNMAQNKAAMANNPMSGMSMGDMDRAAAPRVVYVTETKTEGCSCKSTPGAMDPMHSMHISQIPVDVPAAPSSSSMMGGMAAASAPASSMSHGMAVPASSSSVIFRQKIGASATPSPSGASPNRYNAYEGAAPKASVVQSGLAAVGVAAVMGLMIAL